MKLEKILKETFAVRNRRGGGFSCSFEGSNKTFKTMSELAEYIVGKVPKLKNDATWQEWKASFGEDPDTFFDKLNERIEECLIRVLDKKAQAAQIISQADKGSVLDPINKTVTYMPPQSFNHIDKMICSRIRYCAEDNCIYVKDVSGLRLIGSLGALSKDPTSNGLCHELQKSMGANFNEGKEISISEVVDLALKNTNMLKSILTEQVTRELTCGTKWEDIEIEIEDQVKFRPADFNGNDFANFIDMAVENFCVKKFMEMAPASLFSARICELVARSTAYEMPADNGRNIRVVRFNEFWVKIVRAGEALSEATYLKNVFTQFAANLKDDELFKLAETPYTYADDDRPALFHFSKDELKANIPADCYKNVEDCKNIMILRSWMNEAEYRFVMAWAYAAIRPLTIPSSIALLLWTGGGTGKSSFVEMIKEAICMATGASETDIYFQIKGDKFDEDQRNWVPDGEIGLTKAALVNIDEATTKTIELYKDFSGSAGGNRLATRKNYENTLVNKIHGKFIFTTNKGLQLTSDDGSLLRRVAIVKHNETRNVIGLEKLTDEEVVRDYRRQVPMLLKEGRRCLDEIYSLGFSSIDAYAMQNEDIQKNLRESTATTANVSTYETLWGKIKPEWIGEDGYCRVQGKLLKALYRSACEDNGDDDRYFGGFKHFILEQRGLFEKPIETKQAKNFWTLEPRDDDDDEWSMFPRSIPKLMSKNCNNIWFLSPLKNKEDEK